MRNMFRFLWGAVMASALAVAASAFGHFVMALHRIQVYASDFYSVGKAAAIKVLRTFQAKADLSGRMQVYATHVKRSSLGMPDGARQSSRMKRDGNCRESGAREGWGFVVSAS